MPIDQINLEALVRLCYFLWKDLAIFTLVILMCGWLLDSVGMYVQDCVYKFLGTFIIFIAGIIGVGLKILIPINFVIIGVAVAYSFDFIKF